MEQTQKNEKRGYKRHSKMKCFNKKEIIHESEENEEKAVEEAELEDPPNASLKNPSPLVWTAAGASHDDAAAAGATHASPLDAAASKEAPVVTDAAEAAGAELEDPPNASLKNPSPLVWTAAGASHDDAAAAGAPHASPLDLFS